MKLSLSQEPVGPSLMTHNRALHNPPISVPHSGLPSHQNAAVETDYLLVCEAQSRSLTDGRWRFTLEAADGQLILEANDDEFGDLNRLTLLAAVRGLEALEGPSAVTLLSNNRYLIRSLAKSLPRWRQNNFRWDHFGRRMEVQHADLWRRIDHALAIHRVQACLVSSCLVSKGVQSDDQSRPAHTNETNTQKESSSPASPAIRIDAAHNRTSGANEPARSRGVVPAPSRRLRRLINGDVPSARPAATERRRGRFTAEDLEG